MRSSLDRIIELQDEELWRDGKAPEVEDDFLSSEIHIDIWTVPPHRRITQSHAHGRIYLGSNYRNTLIISSGLYPPLPPPPHHHH